MDTSALFGHFTLGLNTSMGSRLSRLTHGKSNRPIKVPDKILRNNMPVHIPRNAQSSQLVVFHDVIGWSSILLSPLVMVREPKVSYACMSAG